MITDRVEREIRHSYFGQLIALMTLFLLGMAVNLYVTVPPNHPGANPPAYFTGMAQSVTWALLRGPVLLALHTALGLILLVFGFRLSVLAIRSRHRPTILIATIGVFAILGAGLNGGSYLSFHQDFSSMIMASLFALAVSAYVVGLWLLPPHPEPGKPAGRG